MMQTIIDFHSHVLPDIDDGSHSLEESIAMLQMEAEQGITHVVATPHFYPQYDTPERFLCRRAKAEALLREEMQKYSGLPKLSVGAEVYYFPGISHSEAILGLTIDQTRCMLIEMPNALWTDSMYRELEEMHTRQGLIPVVAHVDRYISRFRTHGIPKRLAQLPVIVQANAEFFLQKSTASMALRMLKQNKIHILGSDCHNLSSRRPELGEAVEVIRNRLGDEVLEDICHWQRFALQGQLQHI